MVCECVKRISLSGRYNIDRDYCRTRYSQWPELARMQCEHTRTGYAKREDVQYSRWILEHLYSNVNSPLELLSRRDGVYHEHMCRSCVSRLDYDLALIERTLAPFFPISRPVLLRAVDPTSFAVSSDVVTVVEGPSLKVDHHRCLLESQVHFLRYMQSSNEVWYHCRSFLVCRRSHSRLLDRDVNTPCTWVLDEQVCHYP